MPEKLIVETIESKYLVLMILSWAARLALRSDLTVALVIRQLIISGLIGYVASEYATASTFDEWISISIFCAAVFLADDILAILLGFGKYAKDNQDHIFKRITKYFAGK